MSRGGGERGRGRNLRYVLQKLIVVHLRFGFAAGLHRKVAGPHHAPPASAADEPERRGQRKGHMMLHKKTCSGLSW